MRQKGGFVSHEVWEKIRERLELERTWYMCKFCEECIHGLSILKHHVEINHKDEIGG